MLDLLQKKKRKRKSLLQILQKHDHMWSVEWFCRDGHALILEPVDIFHYMATGTLQISSKSQILT